MALVEFIKGKNKTYNGLRRCIEYVMDENKVYEIDTNKNIDKLLEISNQGNRLLNYVKREDKTFASLVTGINCSPQTAIEEMANIKKMYNKEDGRLFVHFVHSYSKHEDITPELAHEISLKLLEDERFKGFQILASTHVDKDHIHTHFVLNTVNAETGLKWQQSKKELEDLKEYSNKLCFEYGLKYSFVEPKSEKNKFNSRDEYNAKKQGRSYKHETFLAVKECKKYAVSKEDFIKKMKELGYGVRWQDSRKDITFTTPAGRKINNDKLYPPESYTKEALLKKFELNKQWQEKQKGFKARQEEFKANQQFENTKQLIINTARSLANDPDPKIQALKDYPLSYLEGQVLKEKMIEEAKGRGLDWEVER